MSPPVRSTRFYFKATLSQVNLNKYTSTLSLRGSDLTATFSHVFTLVPPLIQDGSDRIWASPPPQVAVWESSHAATPVLTDKRCTLNGHGFHHMFMTYRLAFYILIHIPAPSRGINTAVLTKHTPSDFPVNFPNKCWAKPHDPLSSVNIDMNESTAVR